MLKAYRINFLSISSQIRAYTLFGALCWAYRLAYGEEKLTKFLEEFKENPKFLISSPFPVVKYCENCNEEENIKSIKETFLFPKPILPLKMKYEIPDISKDKEKYLEYICKKKERKNYKKAQFITEDVLKDFINGEINEEAKFIEEEKYKVFDKKIIYKSSKELKFLSDIKSTLLTKNAINRITSTSENLYTEEGTFYDMQFFLVKFYDSSIIKTFEVLLKITENLGIGKNKNIGWGNFEIKKLSTFDWLDEYINNSEYFITLSPIIPSEEKNIDISRSFYEFGTYKAPVENTFNLFLLKQKVIYLKEGSIIKSANKNYKGQLKQVVENPAIYQYGLEFPIKVKKL